MAAAASAASSVKSAASAASPDFKVHILAIGATGVGKSTIGNLFCLGEDEDYGSPGLNQTLDKQTLDTDLTSSGECPKIIYPVKNEEDITKPKLEKDKNNDPVYRLNTAGTVDSCTKYPSTLTALYETRKPADKTGKCPGKLVRGSFKFTDLPGIPDIDPTNNDKFYDFIIHQLQKKAVSAILFVYNSERENLKDVDMKNVSILFDQISRSHVPLHLVVNNKTAIRRVDGRNAKKRAIARAKEANTYPFQPKAYEQTRKRCVDVAAIVKNAFRDQIDIKTGWAQTHFCYDQQCLKDEIRGLALKMLKANHSGKTSPHLLDYKGLKTMFTDIKDKEKLQKQAKLDLIAEIAKEEWKLKCRENELYWLRRERREAGQASAGRIVGSIFTLGIAEIGWANKRARLDKEIEHKEDAIGYLERRLRNLRKEKKGAAALHNLRVAELEKSRAKWEAFERALQVAKKKAK